jgi:Holliday junction resolvasome RuvABC endonuclease subunit
VLLNLRSVPDQPDMADALAIAIAAAARRLP